MSKASIRRISPPPQCENCEVPLRSIGLRTREAFTLSGAIRFRRLVFECPRCRAAVAPTDQETGISKGFKLSHEFQRRIGWLSASLPYARVPAAVAELLGLKVSVAQCQRVVLRHGERIDTEQRKREARFNAPVGPDHPDPPEATLRPERLLLGADAGCVLTRGGQENKNVWCGRALDLEARGQKQDEGRRFLAQSLHAASAENFEDFGERMKAMAWEAGLRGAREVAFIGDGAACLWKWVNENLPGNTIAIQDFWHVSEHLAEICRTVFKEVAGESERLSRWKTMLLESRVDDIADELREEHKTRRGANRTLLEREIGYLEHGRDRMDYARYLREDWPIGSGLIEAEVKCLIKERFDVTGARWDREMIFALLAMRLAVFNDRWQEHWALN